jgi:ELWxxDGT repeat protein
MKKTLLIAITALVATAAEAQPIMVKDIYQGTKSSSPSEYVGIGNKVYFKTRDTLNPYGISYLYESDGTDAGTKKLLKLGNSNHFKAFNNKILFVDDTTGGTNWEPYITDLTQAGTFKLKEIYPGLGVGSGAACDAVIGNTAFLFGSASGQYGFWKTDGTSNGTTLMFYADRNRAIVFNNKVYFWGKYNNVTGLWSFDASSTTPTLIKKHINPAYGDFALAIDSNSFYYVANDSTHGFEPWVSDGTPTGTAMIKDINPGITRSCDEGGSGNYTSMAIMNNKMYFNPVSPTIGRELWETNGTDAGTKLAIDITPGSGSSSLKFSTAIGNILYFSVKSSGNNVLWSSDGVTAAPLLDKNNSTIAFNSPGLVIGNKLFFTGTPLGAQDIGDEPFITDGTPAGTELLLDIDPTPYSGGISQQSDGLPILVGNTIYFGANDNVHGTELWKYTAGAVTAINNVAGSAPFFSLYPNPASNQLTLVSNETIKTVEVYSITGVLQRTMPFTPQIDISDMATGLYFIKAFSDKGISIQKFVKQ